MAETKLSIAALIPMKKNSERVPNKNMKLFNGKPLYHAIVNTLLKSKFINSIYVDTDSEIIIEDILKNFPTILILNRPIELQGDFVSMNEIINYNLKKLDYDIFLQTHSTNPLVNTHTVDLAISNFIENLDCYDSLFSVTKIQSRFYWSDGSPLNHDANNLIRTQDLNPIYEENSNLYIFTKLSFSNSNKKRIGLKPLMFEMNKIESIDIDELEDFNLAELISMNNLKY
jgi:CMP-N-acetylneuraminic acid synthetase